ncbi:Fructose 1,6-bisphosphate aldolase [Phaffia rhodozyma]|uniref:Fructose-bisphosphate aldolase n=1 Tax=Phaffia rhodozyma TaxID=264483 RepID=A0A0F7SMU3_PHARH|nr:Fructose 1,6-bisphosphate aldolase [Phaffia rhodozyma]
MVSTLPETLRNNRTLEILRKADEGSYGVVAMNVYDIQSAIGTIRAAERTNSPAIIEIFPVTLHYLGKPGLQCLLSLAKEAKVPIAIHLDHATTDHDIDTALAFAEQGVKFDSIMVDSSHADTDEENIEISRKHIERATGLGIACEVELGRLEGGEAGLRVIADGQLTDPAKASSLPCAERFMRETGATLLAPCIGNLHGRYLSQPKLRFDLLKKLEGICRPAGHYLVMHGTDDLEDQIWLNCIAAGARKVRALLSFLTVLDMFLLRVELFV